MINYSTELIKGCIDFGLAWPIKQYFIDIQDIEHSIIATSIENIVRKIEFNQIIHVF